MEVLLDQTRFALQYNCSSYSIDDVPIGERQNILLGVTLLVLFAIFEPIHALTLVAMYRFARQQIAYRVIFLMGIGHMVILCITALLTGIFLLQGSVYCSAPYLNLVAGMIALFCWAFTTTLSVFLAFERCLEQVWPKMARRLFSGYRYLLWLLSILFYSVYYGFFTLPLSFCSITASWEYNPHMGYLHATAVGQFQNTLDVVHTFAVAVILPALYTIYSILFTLKWTQVAHLTEADRNKLRMVFIQVFALSLLLTAFCLNDSLSNYLPWSDIVNVLGTILWPLLDGAPPFVFLALNGSIREECTQICRSLLQVGKKINHNNNINVVVATKKLNGVKEAWAG